MLTPRQFSRRRLNSIAQVEPTHFTKICLTRRAQGTQRKTPKKWFNHRTQSSFERPFDRLAASACIDPQGTCFGLFANRSNCSLSGFNDGFSDRLLGGPRVAKTPWGGRCRYIAPSFYVGRRHGTLCAVCASSLTGGRPAVVSVPEVARPQGGQASFTERTPLGTFSLDLNDGWES
jgi:hypothetical protein